MIAAGLFRLGRDAEVRFTQSGEPVAGLSLAFNYGRKDADGKQPTQWIEASLWGKRAESVAQYLTKGTLIYATLEDPHVEVYDKRDGGQGAKLVARVSNIEFTGRANAGEQQAEHKPAQQRPAPASRPAQRQAVADEFDDDSIPF